jgi:MFS family permease
MVPGHWRKIENRGDEFLMSTASIKAPAMTWRTPAVIVICGCLIAVLTFGLRSSLGFFMTPISQENAWGRDVFAFAIALQNLLWGMGQPLAGAIADRFGTVRVLSVGAILYGLGLAGMAYSSTPGMLDFTAGVLLGFGLAGCSFTLVIAAFGKLLPERWRSLSFGAGTAAGSFGQFLFSPTAVYFIDSIGWKNTIVVFGAFVLLIVPLSWALATPRAGTSPGVGTAAPQSLTHALSEAFRHRSFVLLTLGYFTCGFQLAFITTHMPAYLADRGLSAQVGGWTIAVIGLFNIIGSLSSGWLGGRMPKRYILAFIYFMRAAAILAFISFPVTAVTALLFGASMGLLWLSTVPPTSALVQIMFGSRWLGTLVGFTFFSHQVGGFMGVWLGGLVYERTGSYDTVWWLAILFGILSALINLPIVEKPVYRAAAAAA